jgi:hypothetical protein
VPSDLDSRLASAEAELASLERAIQGRPWDVAPLAQNRLRCAAEEVRVLRVLLGRPKGPAITGARSENPFVGLASYEESESPRFFGRHDAARDLLDLVLRERLAVLLGRSGAGKSSLIRCRLLPLLRSMGHVAIALRFDPSLPGEPAVARVLDAAKALTAFPVVVIDQLEEAYTRGAKSDRDATRRMVDGLVERGVHVLLSLREDYAAELIEIGSGLLLPGTTQRLRSFASFAEVRDILVHTFGLGGIELDAKAAGVIAERLLGTGECPPPHLQIYGGYAFEEAKRLGAPRAGAGFADDLLPVETVIRQRFVRILESLPRSDRERTRRVLTALVTPAGARRRATIPDILERSGLDRDEALASIRLLEDLHFLVGSDESGYELSHDYVAGSITERFFTEHDRRLLLAAEVLRHGYQDWLRFGVRLGPSRLRAITACLPSDLGLTPRTAAFLYVVILAELRAFRAAERRHLSWDVFMSDLKGMVTREFDRYDLDQLDQLIQKIYPWVLRIAPAPGQVGQGDIGRFVLHYQGNALERDIVARFGAGDDQIEAAIFFRSLPALDGHELWSLIAEAAPAAWLDLTYVADLRWKRIEIRGGSDHGADLFRAFDRVIGSWDESPDAAMALIDPMIQSLSAGRVSPRKRSTLARVLAKLRSEVAAPDLDGPWMARPEPVGRDRIVAHLIGLPLWMGDGELLTEVLRVCSGGSKRFKALALAAIDEVVADRNIARRLPGAAADLAGTSDADVRSMIAFLAGMAYRAEPSRELSGLLHAALSDPSPAVVDVALRSIEAAGVPLDEASAGRLLAGGGAASPASRSLLVGALPSTWPELEALGVEKIWDAMAAWDADELAAKLVPFVAELGAWARVAGSDRVVEAAKSGSPSVRLFAVAVLDAAAPITGVDWLQIALGPRCTAPPDGRAKILRAAAGDPPDGLVAIAGDHVSPFLEAAIVRFAWTALTDHDRRWLARLVERRHAKLEEEGTFIEAGLLMPGAH